MKEIILAVMFFAAYDMAEARSRTPVLQFIKANPCPSTGKNRPPCPGYVVDHKRPLCLFKDEPELYAYMDHPRNMVWQEKSESLEKDKVEHALCRWVRKL